MESVEDILRNFDFSLNNATMEFVLILVAFLIFYYILNKVVNKYKDNKFLNMEEYFPVEETRTLRQVFYLIMISVCFIYILASFTIVGYDSFYVSLFDFFISTLCFLMMKRDTLKDKILLFFLIPFGSINFLIVNNWGLINILDFAHLIAFVFVMKYYYHKFIEYTENNGLGIAILLLYIIVFISMIATHFTENKNLLDALVMSSNAFTSNGYAVLGDSIPGKINSLLLVWSGYIISGVSTATLTAALLMKHFNKKFEELEKLIREKDD